MSSYTSNNKINTIYSLFNRRKILLPVIHVINVQQTLINAEILYKNNVQGCWLINHSCSDKVFADAFIQVKTKYPGIWVGINYLGGPFAPIVFPENFQLNLTDSGLITLVCPIQTLQLEMKFASK